MTININGLTPHQVALLDEMWACDTFEEYETFYALLDEQDQQQADLLQRLVLIESLDADMANDTVFPEANRLLDKFK